MRPDCLVLPNIDVFRLRINVVILRRLYPSRYRCRFFVLWIERVSLGESLDADRAFAFALPIVNEWCRQQVVAHNEAQEDAYRRLNSEGKKPTYSHMARGARVLLR